MMNIMVNMAEVIVSLGFGVVFAAGLFGLAVDVLGDVWRAPQ